MFTEDLGLFFTDFSVTATWSGASGQVIVNFPDSLVLDDAVQATQPVIAWPRGQWPGIGEGATVVTETASYRLRRPPEAFDDGNLVRAEVKIL